MKQNGYFHDTLQGISLCVTIAEVDHKASTAIKRSECCLNSGAIQLVDTLYTVHKTRILQTCPRDLCLSEASQIDV